MGTKRKKTERACVCVRVCEGKGTSIRLNRVEGEWEWEWECESHRNARKSGEESGGLGGIRLCHGTLDLDFAENNIVEKVLECLWSSRQGTSDVKGKGVGRRKNNP